MESAVDNLHLSVHVPRGQEAVVGRAERFSRDVLEAFSRVVEARLPGRVVLLRRIAVRWSLTEAELADPTELNNRATELADTLPSAGAGVAPNDTVAVFEDEAAWLISYLRWRATSAGDAHAWFHAAWRDAERAGTPPVPNTARMALARLEMAGELSAILGALPRVTLASLATALGAQAGAAVQANRSALRDVEPPPDFMPARAPAAVGRGPTSMQSETRPPSSGERQPVVPSATGFADAQSRSDHAAPAIPMSDDGMTEQGPVGHAFSPTDMSDPMMSAVTAALHCFDEAVTSDTDMADDTSPLTTRFGGLFFLLSLALELGVGEALWKACLPEEFVMADAMRSLLGADAGNDPAAPYFGGVPIQEGTDPLVVSPEQHAEIAIELLCAASVALARGVATGPEMVLHLAAGPSGRLLVACVPGPFVVFAWPAPDAHAVAAGLATFFSAWPLTHPQPCAPDVLLALDTSKRLRQLSDPPQAVSLSAGSSAPVSALLTQVAGTLGACFAARLGEALAGPMDLVSRHLAVPGRIMLTPGGMTVRLPMDAIEISLRRAALDRDPGWVPWLRRTVRIEFMPSGDGDLL